MYRLAKDKSYMIGYTQNSVAFIFDAKDYELVSKYTWHLSKRGYITTKINRKNVPLHQLIMENKKGYDIDHISRNKLDNRRGNLRICTHQENSFNQPKRITNTLGFMGVSFARNANKYEAYIYYNGKNHYLGLYSTAKEAAIIRDQAAIKFFGDYANLNFKDKCVVSCSA